ncbi:sugar transferase [Microbacterium sp. NPDC056044]|uniref:sugar transferase n=1 Tax=Microbacterium sp. NPDC056044 TaxID=3345690 RepID=UPI0035E08DE4
MRRGNSRVRRATRHVKPRRSSRDWPARYAGRLVYSDLAVIAAVLVAFRIFGMPPYAVEVSWVDGPTFPYLFLLVLVAVLWLIALSVFDTRDRHIVGSGTIEYARIANASLALFAFLVSLAFFFRIEVSRLLLLVALPFGAVLLIMSRWIWRQWLRRQQKSSKYVYRAVVLGEATKAAHVVAAIQRTPATGFDIVGVVSNGRSEPFIRGVPVVGGFSTAVNAMDAVDADTVIVAGSADLDPLALRRLGWAVADRDANLVVAPELTDVAGPRIHSRAVAGLPLVHVDFPALEGYRRFIKRAFDIVGSVLLVLIASPLMIATAIAIRMEGPGSILYRQVRIGRRGTPFGMIKFRSMTADADDQLASLLDLQGTSDRPLHKVVDDPRITQVGRFIRRHSIDELPQLFNVLVGTMSLVGPRPQRQAEVILYDDAAERRLLVKPGMSGLWQVSGRSSLTWEDAIRLDLYYVENWSFMQDLQILFRTVKAVLVPGDSAG